MSSKGLQLDFQVLDGRQIEFLIVVGFLWENFPYPKNDGHNEVINANHDFINETYMSHLRAETLEYSTKAVIILSLWYIVP